MDSFRWSEKSQPDGVKLPESPREPIEYLSRSSSVSAMQEVCRALALPASYLFSKVNQENTVAGDSESESARLSGNRFSFGGSSVTSHLVLERIMSQSMHNGQEISPLTSGRLSYSSEHYNGSHTEETDSTAPISPSDEFEDVIKYLRANNTLQPLFTNIKNYNNTSGNNTPIDGNNNTVKKWLKQRRNKKKEESRARNAQIHAAVSVAGLAASVAAVAASTAAASSTGKDEAAAKTDVAVASAAMLVAAQCVDAAEAMGADRDRLMSSVSSAINVRSHEDISTLTAAASTALRGAATLKARALKEVWSISTVIPIDKGLGVATGNNNSNGFYEGLDIEENFLGVCNQELLARGSELLKRTRNGDLHWKIVSVYIHRGGKVMLRMKSKHVGNTITKRKENVVLEVYKDIPAWPGRHLFEDGEQRKYFGLRTEVRGVVEFECKNQKQYEMWTQGVSRLLYIVAERRRRFLS
ncbi:unnamed protein product [Cuscuta epithymum]|uniref:VAN3-binding protein n=1 Tax=Cuscuta epithymum TaxID=186058 RepID=A0AAV0FZL5_9ASTE|nr:unnamed protein product [Cuscuta epithymum]CAH9140605.1 unnamed protein product [Cuscuta epithymum]